MLPSDSALLMPTSAEADRVRIMRYRVLRSVSLSNWAPKIVPRPLWNKGAPFGSVIDNPSFLVVLSGLLSLQALFSSPWFPFGELDPCDYFIHRLRTVYGSCIKKAQERRARQLASLLHCLSVLRSSRSFEHNEN